MDDRHLQAVSEFMPPAGIVRPRSAHDTVESVVEKFAKDSERLFMSPDDATALATALYNRAERLTPEPDVVVGIATGGLFVAHAVARGLSVPCHVLRIQRKATRLKRHVSRCRPLVRLVAAVLEAPAIGSPTRALLDRMNGLDESDTASPPPVAGKHVILVDDCVESGQTLERAMGIIGSLGASSVRSAVITWAAEPPLGKPSPVVPDIWLNRLVPFFPWSANSPWYRDFESWLSAQDGWVG